MKTLVEAREAIEASRAELLHVQEQEDWFLACDRASHRCYALKWLRDERRILTKHGLSGFAEVREPMSHVLCFERGRIHLCSKWPCGTKFDNRKEPCVCHAFCYEADMLAAPAEAPREPEVVAAFAEALQLAPALPPAPAEPSACDEDAGPRSLTPPPSAAALTERGGSLTL